MMTPANTDIPIIIDFGTSLAFSYSGSGAPINAEWKALVNDARVRIETIIATIDRIGLN